MTKIESEPAPGRARSGRGGRPRPRRAALAAADRELFAAEDGAGALFAAGGAEPLGDDAAVAREDQRHARLAQRGGLHDLGDARRLGARGLEELAARGHVEEEIAHLDRRAGRAAARGDAGRAAALDADQGALFGVAAARAQLEAAHRGDAGERLAAEAEAAQVREVVHRGDLAGGVAEDGEAGVVAIHPGAVVGDAEEDGAALLGVDADAAGLGVERVLHELLDHARGPLDDLAGSDLVGQIFRQDVDPPDHALGHGSSALSAARATASEVELGAQAREDEQADREREELDQDQAEAQDPPQRLSAGVGGALRQVDRERLGEAGDRLDAVGADDAGERVGDARESALAARAWRVKLRAPRRAVMARPLPMTSMPQSKSWATLSGKTMREWRRSASTSTVFQYENISVGSVPLRALAAAEATSGRVPWRRKAMAVSAVISPWTPMHHVSAIPGTRYQGRSLRSEATGGGGIDESTREKPSSTRRHTRPPGNPPRRWRPLP